MRKQFYLSKPENDNGFLSLDNKELHSNLPKIVKIAQAQRQENIMKVIRHNDFSAGFTTGVKFGTLNEGNNDRLGTDYETQLNILIASEENAELRENLIEYIRHSRLDPHFDEEKIVDDILARDFSFIKQ